MPNKPVARPPGRSEPWAHLRGLAAVPDAPVSDDPSGLYCLSCRGARMAHCASPEYRGDVRPMRPKKEAINRAGKKGAGA